MVYEPTRSYDTTVSISIRRDGGCHRGIRDLDGKRGIVCLVQLSSPVHYQQANVRLLATTEYSQTKRLAYSL